MAGKRQVFSLPWWCSLPFLVALVPFLLMWDVFGLIGLSTSSAPSPPPRRLQLHPSNCLLLFESDYHGGHLWSFAAVLNLIIFWHFHCRFYSFLRFILSFVIGSSQCTVTVSTTLDLFSCLQLKLLIHLLWLLSTCLFVSIISVDPLDSVESDCELCLCVHVCTLTLCTF